MLARCCVQVEYISAVHSPSDAQRGFIDTGCVGKVDGQWVRGGETLSMGGAPASYTSNIKGWRRLNNLDSPGTVARKTRDREWIAVLIYSATEDCRGFRVLFHAQCPLWCFSTYTMMLHNRYPEWLFHTQCALWCFSTYTMMLHN